MMYHGGGPRFEIGQRRPSGSADLSNFSPGVAAVLGGLRRGDELLFSPESGKGKNM